VKGSDTPKLREALLGNEWESVWKPACDKEFGTLYDLQQVGDEVDFKDMRSFRCIDF
jgi:hypothetical protein